MAIIKVKRGTYSATLNYGELAIAGDRLYFGKADDTPVLLAQPNIDNAFSTGQTVPNITVTNHIKFGPGTPANDDAHIE